LSVARPSPVTARHRHDLESEIARRAPQRLEGVVAHPGDVALGGGNQLGTLEQVRSEAAYLLAHQGEIGGRLAPARAGGVHDVQEDPRALDVTKELQTKPRALMRPLDDAGDVRGHERLTGDIHGLPARG